MGASVRSTNESSYINISVSSLLSSVAPRFRLAPREDHAGELVNLVQEPGGEQEAAAE